MSSDILPNTKTLFLPARGVSWTLTPAVLATTAGRLYLLTVVVAC